jgi:hypothetical protein
MTMLNRSHTSAWTPQATVLGNPTTNRNNQTLTGLSRGVTRPRHKNPLT